METRLDEPRQSAPRGSEPIPTIGRNELKAKLDRGDDFKLSTALDRWAHDANPTPGPLHFDTPEKLYKAVRPDDEVVRRYARGHLDWEDVGLPRLLARNDDEVAWWLRKSGADHHAKHLDRLREWQAELLARRSRGVVDE